MDYSIITLYSRKIKLTSVHFLFAPTHAHAPTLASGATYIYNNAETASHKHVFSVLQNITAVIQQRFHYEHQIFLGGIIHTIFNKSLQ